MVGDPTQKPKGYCLCGCPQLMCEPGVHTYPDGSYHPPSQGGDTEPTEPQTSRSESGSRETPERPKGRTPDPTGGGSPCRNCNHGIHLHVFIAPYFCTAYTSHGFCPCQRYEHIDAWEGM